MEAAFRYRMATRLARRLREAGRPLPLPALGEALGLRGPVERVVRPLLDGRFLLEEGVGLWEWRYPFPLEGEAVVVLDLETTGLAPGLDEVIEVGLLRLEGGGASPSRASSAPPARRAPSWSASPASPGRPWRRPLPGGGSGEGLPPPRRRHLGDPQRRL